MIQQLSIFDLPPQENAPKNLFGDYKYKQIEKHTRPPRHDTSLAPCPTCKKQFNRYHRGMKYCSVDCKRKANQKFISCNYCNKEFFASESTRKYCCHNCFVYGESYGTIERYESIVAKARNLLESGTPNKQVAKECGIPLTAIKRILDEHYAGENPVHTRAIALYQEGRTEEEISAIVGTHTGAVVTWLMRKIPGYVPPKKLERKDKESKRKEKRKQIAKYLAVYRNLKTVKAVADHFGVRDEAAQLILGGCKGYKRARAKMLLRAKAAFSSHEYARSTRSRKYKTELDFENVMFKQILKIDPKAQRQVQYLRQKTCDIVCTIAGIKYAIELKTELKEPKFSSCSMQAFVAAKQLDAVAIYCHPNDCWPTESGREVISIVFGDKVRVINENELMEFLHGKAKEIRQVYSGTGGRIGVYEGIHQQAFCAA
jgi:hypothetical protein